TFRTRTRMGNAGLSSLPLWGGGGWGLVRPGPVAHVRHILTVVPRVLPVPEPLVHHVLPDVAGARTQPGNAIDDIHHEVKAIEVVEHHHVEGRRGCPLLLVTA